MQHSSALAAYSMFTKTAEHDTEQNDTKNTRMNNRIQNKTIDLLNGTILPLGCDRYGPI